jgi:hypothetical protein
MSRIHPEGLTRSVLERLKLRAVERQRAFSEILELYAIERFLYRLGRSQYRDRYFLKGALLLRYWIGADARPTRDIDLMASGRPNIPDVRAFLEDLCRLEVEDDGIAFDTEALEIRRIRPESRVAGIRAKFTGRIGNVRLRYQGDAVVPPPNDLMPEALLNFPVIGIKAVTPYTAVAEKLEAMLVLGAANSRMKDYYDLMILSQKLDFDGEILKDAVRATFQRRSTPLPEGEPEGLAPAFAEDAVNAMRWNAFITKGMLSEEKPNLSQVIYEIRRFALPVLDAAREDAAFSKRWPPGGPWRRR